MCICVWCRLLSNTTKHKAAVVAAGGVKAVAQLLALPADDPVILAALGAVTQFINRYVHE